VPRRDGHVAVGTNGFLELFTDLEIRVFGKSLLEISFGKRSSVVRITGGHV
jgi:hypothetical protein